MSANLNQDDDVADTALDNVMRHRESECEREREEKEEYRLVNNVVVMDQVAYTWAGMLVENPMMTSGNRRCTLAVSLFTL